MNSISPLPHRNGEDLRTLPLLARKQRLRKMLPKRSPNVLFVNQAVGTGEIFYYEVHGRNFPSGVHQNLMHENVQSGPTVLHSEKSVFR